MQRFDKEKSPGLDGWMVEFFIKYFDILGTNVQEAVEESRSSGSIISSLNSTFIALIPKVDKPARFGDFRPISLYKPSYKVIAKLIEIRLKQIP